MKIRRGRVERKGFCYVKATNDDVFLISTEHLTWQMTKVKHGKIKSGQNKYGSPALMSSTAKSPTRTSPFTFHFCVSQLGWQLWFINRLRFPFGPASIVLQTTIYLKAWRLTKLKTAWRQKVGDWMWRIEYRVSSKIIYSSTQKHASYKHYQPCS